MIAFKDGKTILIDVKTKRKDYRDNVSRSKDYRTEEQKQLGVVFLAFNPDDRKLSWVAHKE
jgi:hypothetical protein